MLPYYLLFIIPILTYVVESLNRGYQNKARNITISFFFLILIVMLSLRSVECGVDLTNYKHYFDSVYDMTWEEVFNQKMETGYFVFQKLISYLTRDFNVFLAIVALVSLLPIWWFYYKESEFSLLTVVLFMAVAPFSMFFSGLRQSIAMGIGVLAWMCVSRKKIILFIITTLIATTFHQSALVLLFLLPLYYINISKKWIMPVAIIIAIVFLFSKQIFPIIVSLSERYKDNNVIESTGAYGMLALLVIFTIYAYIVPNENKLDKGTIALRNILVFSVCIQCFAPIHSLVMRMNYYFLLFIPILIPKIIKYSEKENIKITSISIYVMLFVFIGFFFYKAYFGADILQIFPYVPYWGS